MYLFWIFYGFTRSCFKATSTISREEFLNLKQKIFDWVFGKKWFCYRIMATGNIDVEVLTYKLKVLKENAATAWENEKRAK